MLIFKIKVGSSLKDSSFCNKITIVLPFFSFCIRLPLQIIKSYLPLFPFMNKRSENNISTSRILKSKYLDKSKDKQQTLPLRNQHQQQSPLSNKRKIKLVDLCPEEKLKVGELIKTLDERRAANEELARELEDVRGKK